MANFLLVHGAWHGAWCWQRVLPGLFQAGHRAHAVTLTGLGERAHLLHRDIDLETHIQDVVSAMDAEEMQNVILVTHSYAGVIGTAIASRSPQRLAHLVYVDAVVPAPGESWSSTHAEATRAARLASTQQSNHNAFAPPNASVYGLTDVDQAWVNRRQTPMPAAPYTQTLDFDPTQAALVPRTYVSCVARAFSTIDTIRPRVRDSKFWGGAWLPGSQVIDLQTGHDPMISAPEALLEILLSRVTSVALKR
jgi:pimeloyl-ACP methyl ester carboxylesterase